MADTGYVNIHGKQYKTVAARVNDFRESFGPGYGLLTEIVHADKEVVRMKALIVNPEGAVVATGHAEEYRDSSKINKTSALENAETSAIGRALAAFGLGGTEFASADEVARAITGKPCAPVVDEAVEDWLAKIDEATDMDELKDTYNKAIEACPNSKSKIIAATNVRKAAIK
jgi:hypothetical protein